LIHSWLVKRTPLRLVCLSLVCGVSGGSSPTALMAVFIVMLCLWAKQVAARRGETSLSELSLIDGLVLERNGSEATQLPLESYGLPVVKFPVGTKFYSCVQHNLDPNRELWTFLNVEYLAYCATVEDAAEFKGIKPEAMTQEIVDATLQELPEIPLLRVFEVTERPCSMLIWDHKKDASQLAERFGSGATFQNSDFFAKPGEEQMKRKVDLLTHVVQDSPAKGYYNTRATALKIDGFVQCDAGLEAAVFTLGSWEQPSCIQQVGEDKLPTRAEKELQEGIVTKLPDCKRFTQ